MTPCPTRSLEKAGSVAESRHALFVRGLPCWSEPIDLIPLSGGLSNVCFKVVHGSASFVARLGCDVPAHHVIRNRELEVSKAAAAVGLSPKIAYSQPGVMVFDFVEGHTFREENVKENISRIADIVRNAHQELYKHVRGPAFLFWPFHIFRDYAQTLREGASRMMPQLSTLLTAVDRLENDVHPTDLCVCHNDLLAGNFIDDGNRIWLIDWEYGAYGDPFFDLGNIAALSDFTRVEETRLLTSYLNREPTEADRRRFDAMRCIAQWREAMWSMVSELHMSVEGVDYVAYTNDHLGRFNKAYGKYAARYRGTC
ncbi:thiamine kinase-like enzyme [Mesorhizobium tianshanense]|uniref:Thiamine kinase-like enzyme n=2 Tax=Mesorhizobium tianshanense TaxID=39844 RepID=A0A562NMF9_9HYPH|nr:thiamine kinase-like enzyme [Mesorhizobium tianshanense]